MSIPKFMEGKTLKLPHAGGRPKEPIEGRFWAKVAEPNERGCRLWIGGKSKHASSETRVGQISYEDKSTAAHVIMWLLAKGERPQKQIQPYVCHNYLCMTVEHWHETPDRNVRRGREASMTEIQEESRRKKEANARIREDDRLARERKQRTRDRNKAKLRDRYERDLGGMGLEVAHRENIDLDASISDEFLANFRKKMGKRPPEG